MALDNSDEGNGALVVLPGSHQSGVFEHRTTTRRGNLLSVNQEMVDVNDVCADAEAHALRLDVPIGSFTIHHGHTVHSSPPNNSTRRRCGFAVRYVKATTAIVSDPSRQRTFPAVMIARGDKVKHCIPTIPPPPPVARDAEAAGAGVGAGTRAGAGAGAGAGAASIGSGSAAGAGGATSASASGAEPEA